MKPKVRHKNPISRLSKGIFQMNKSRNVMAVCAIALTTVLFAALFTLGFSVVHNMQLGIMRKTGGTAHASLKLITDEQYNIIKDNFRIKQISYQKILCDSVGNEELIKQQPQFCYMDDLGREMNFFELTGGHKAMAADEIMTDTLTLELMGIPLREGEEIVLQLDIRGQLVERTFRLAGWWENPALFQFSVFLSSEAYVKAHEEELVSEEYQWNHIRTGIVYAYIKFDSTAAISYNLEQLIAESGFTMQEGHPNYMVSSINWAYMGTHFDSDGQTMAALLGAAILIGAAGYLMIYNVFQISVIKDIKLYGLLKTIGTTTEQLENVIVRQVAKLSFLGIPIGLAIGYFTGSKLVPVITRLLDYGADFVETVPDPKIFIFAAVFSGITVFISMSKPVKLAGSITPLEASRYTEVKSGKRQKKSTDGMKMSKMAYANLLRNKKRTILVLLSIALSLVLFQAVYTLSKSLDMETYLSKFMIADFQIAHVDYFNYQYQGEGSEVSKTMIEEIRKQDSFLQEAFLYNRPGFMEIDCGKGRYEANLYGADDALLQKFKVIRGEVNLSELSRGDSMLLGVPLDDYGEPEWEELEYRMGDRVTLFLKDEETGEYAERSFVITGVVAIESFINNGAAGHGHEVDEKGRMVYYHNIFYLPTEVYQTVYETAPVMTVLFDVKDGREEEMDSFLKEYTQKREPMMHYMSKKTLIDEFKGVEAMFVSIGGVLAAFIGFISILNFINAILTGILTRKKEFAMLKSIGMTEKQLRKMLCYEGTYYILGSFLLAMLLGTGVSFLIVKNICNRIWFFTYQFHILPVVLVLPVLVVIGFFVPWIIYKLTKGKSVIENLRNI